MSIFSKVKNLFARSNTVDKQKEWDAVVAPYKVEPPVAADPLVKLGPEPTFITDVPPAKKPVKKRQFDKKKSAVEKAKPAAMTAKPAAKAKPAVQAPPVRKLQSHLPK